MQSIEYIKENHTILNQIYNILAKIKTKTNKSYCVKSLHILELKKTKKRINRKTSNRYVRNYLIQTGGLKIPNGKTLLANYTTPNHV